MANTYRSAAGAEAVRDWCSAGLARWELPHSTHEVDTSHGTTHVVALGTGDGVCVYLPGTNFNAASSMTVLSQLADKCRVYAADLPGQPGLSAAQRPHPEVPGYAAWSRDLIAWVRERHEHGRIVLAGHSRGAAVALSAEPDSVQGLVLLAPAGLSEVRPSFAMLQATLPWLVRRNSAGSRRLLEYMSGPTHATDDDLVEWMTLVARTCHTTGAPGPLPDDTLLRWRGRQVLVAVGEHDVFFPVSRLRAPCRSMLGREPLVIPGAGHLVVDEEPVLVTELVASLL
ncbi:alpha/beta hydrolase [Nocardioides sp. STR2]|uniref:Alpha/beta hydrolase n=1 Tax=Nocardioides pini TaxID=2975053 RepID=A0ABT4C6Q5_9ACTN|nr:alpha/beta hydrolase [Nocardioides pini]MCY4724641.1 alpha/beta hydrolase [Nocardioides pini]